MARVKRAPGVDAGTARSAPCLPERLAEFRVEDWTTPEDDRTHGELSRFVIAENRWRAEVRLWADSQGLAMASAVALALARPDWETHRRHVADPPY